MLEDEEMDADHDQEEEEEEEDKDEEEDKEDKLHDVEKACHRDTRMVEKTGNHDNNSQKASDQNSRKRRYTP